MNIKNIVKNRLFYKQSGIYIIKNKLNNKIYVGQAGCILTRLLSHYNQSKHNIYLKNAINKYSWSNFKISIKTVKCLKKLNSIEQFYMDKYNCYDKSCGYNICYKASSTRGIKLTSEHKNKLSLIRINNPTFKGRVHSQETKLKMSESQKFIRSKKKPTKKQKEATLKGLLAMMKMGLRKVIQTFPDGNIQIFNSIVECSIFNKTPRQTIDKVLKRKGNKYKNTTIKYYEE